MSYPARADWQELASTGFEHVVCLTDGSARYDPAPLALHCFALQDLYVAGPDAPDEELGRVLGAVDVAVDGLRAGEGVLVHCHAGRGRTGTVIGGAMVRLGHDPDAVIDWLHRLQRMRSKAGWPEHSWQADAVRACAG
jgi:protein-tyrosine phosphatase